jgi:hypothetical protein
MNKNTEYVINKFMSGYPSKRGNIFTDGHTLYSYGEHFPLAIMYRVEGPCSGTCPVRRIIIINADTYSRTTSKHHAALRTILHRGESDYRVLFRPTEDMRKIEDSCTTYLNTSTEQDVYSLSTNRLWELLKYAYLRKGVKRMPFAKWMEECTLKEVLAKL